MLLLCAWPCGGVEPVVEQRPFPDVFPCSLAPAARVVVCNLQSEPEDRRLMFMTLQGIVNRTRPEIYLLSKGSDRRWIDWYAQQKWIREVTGLEHNDELLERYRLRVRGVVVTDPDLPASINVATMIASLEEAVVVSPDLVRQAGLPVLTDLRGRWKTSAEAYRWAFENLWPRLNHHVIACLYPQYHELRDYLVENKIFTLWISGRNDGDPAWADSDSEVKLMEELLVKMPVNIPVLGYPLRENMKGYGEDTGVRLFGKYGKYLVGSASVGNLSVHSGIPAGTLRQYPAPTLPEFNPGKVYYSWIISDGDNLPVATDYNYPKLWSEPVRGQLPLGWSLSPSASVLMPGVMRYYYQTATPNDEFICSVDGVGYTFPCIYGSGYTGRHQDEIFSGFLRQTATYMRRSDMTSIWLHNEYNDAYINRYPLTIPFLNAMFPDYAKQVSKYAEATYVSSRNTPVFRAITTIKWVDFKDRYAADVRQARIIQMADDIRKISTERPAFLNAFAFNWYTDLPALKQISDDLGPDYVPVRPGQLAELYRQSLDQQH